MELQEFIKTAITAIASGIEDAQKDLEQKGIFINPESNELGKAGWRYKQDIEFDLCVKSDEPGKLTVIDQTGIFSNKNLNNIKFKVPVVFPASKLPDETKARGISFGK